jgi:hypothetical protein
MILSKSELIGSLQHEVHILSHLASKVDRAAVDYRPTPKQRSTLELLQYMSIMGPQLIEAAKRGGFDVPTWTAAQQEAAARNFDQTVAAIDKQRELYPALLADVTDADFRREIEMFGQKTTVGALLINLVLGGHAAYRTQLFCYLKECGREELSTMNLWAGTDAPEPANA